MNVENFSSFMEFWCNNRLLKYIPKNFNIFLIQYVTHFLLTVLSSVLRKTGFYYTLIDILFLR